MFKGEWRRNLDLQGTLHRVMNTLSPAVEGSRARARNARLARESVAALLLLPIAAVGCCL